MILRLWDDDAYVTANPHVRSGLTSSNLRWAMTSFEQSNWHPLTWISHMLDCQLFGLNPGPPHLVNVLLQACNVFLLFWILQVATHAVWRSFAVAAIWAVHPLNVETVAWIAQRKSLLSAFFSLLTVAAYGWYIQRRGWPRYLIVAVTFALALLSKPMAVSLPLLLLLFDYWPLHRLQELPFFSRWSRLFLEKLPLFLMSAAASALTEIAQNSGGSVMTLNLLPLPARIENAFISYVAYLAKIFFPVHLSTYYPIRLSPSAGDAIASAIILLAITASVVYLRRLPYLLIGWLFFLLTMIPVIGIVQVGFQGMADRYTYIPSIGLWIAVVWAVADLASPFPAARTLLPVATAVVAIVFAFGTVSYLSAWKNSVTLFAHAHDSLGQPDMWMEQLYGNALFSYGRMDEALEHYQKSCTLQPRTDYCHYNIAHIEAIRGQFRDALGQYQLALQFTASKEMAILCLDESTAALLELGQYNDAANLVARALTLDPSDPTALRLRQQLILSQGSTH